VAWCGTRPVWATRLANAGHGNPGPRAPRVGPAAIVLDLGEPAYAGVPRWIGGSTVRSTPRLRAGGGRSQRVCVQPPPTTINSISLVEDAISVTVVARPVSCRASVRGQFSISTTGPPTTARDVSLRVTPERPSLRAPAISAAVVAAATPQSRPSGGWML
jgi:hypothetical protein